jgi:hypothetical protein
MIARVAMNYGDSALNYIDFICEETWLSVTLYQFNLEYCHRDCVTVTDRDYDDLSYGAA